MVDTKYYGTIANTCFAIWERKNGIIPPEYLLANVKRFETAIGKNDLFQFLTELK